jgi:hypothetical protein
MMKIRLEFVQPKPRFPVDALVRRPGTPEGVVIGMLSNDLADTRATRKYRDELRDVIAGKIPELAGAGNMYMEYITATLATIQLGEKHTAPRVELPTEDLLDAVEQWLTYLEREYGESPIVG